MALPIIKKYRNQWISGIILHQILAVIILLSVVGKLPSAGCPVMECNTDITNCPSRGPLFTAPSNKIAIFKDPSFTGQHYTGAITPEPLLAMPGTQDADWTNPSDWINGMANTPVPSG